MKIKPITLISFLAGLLFLSACEDAKITRNLYDDWWPIHATGSFDDGHFTAKWDSDLSTRGGVQVTFTSKTDPSLNYNRTLYYSGLSFASDRKTFQYITIKDLEYEGSKSLKYYVKDKKIYFEIMNEAGRGTGEYQEGKDLKFTSDDRILIDGVTYERYSAYVVRTATGGSSEKIPISPDGRIPIKIYH